MLGVLEQIVQEFAAGDLVDGGSHLATGLAQELVPRPNRVLPLGGTGRLLDLPPVSPEGNVSDLAPLEDCACPVGSPRHTPAS